MTMPPLLSPDEVRAALTRLPAWRLDGDALCRDFTFEDFGAAFGFMTRVALVAERMDHHPDWRNVWSRVEVRLSTHDAGGITARDIALAAAIDCVAGSVRSPFQ